MPIGSHNMLTTMERVVKTPRTLFRVNNTFDKRGKEIKPRGSRILPIGINPKRLFSR